MNYPIKWLYSPQLSSFKRGRGEIDDHVLCAKMDRYPILHSDKIKREDAREVARTWELLAKEFKTSVDTCKRRWRQIRNDYSRWLVADAHKRRTGQKRSSFLLANELKFLTPHILLADGLLVGEEDDIASIISEASNGRERDSNTAQVKGGRRTFKREPQTAEETVEQGSSKEQNNNSADKTQADNKQPEEQAAVDKSDNVDAPGEEEEEIDNDSTDPDKDQAEFFIKQTSSENLLIISKKQAVTPDPLDDGSKSMSGDTETDADNTSPRRATGRPRRSLGIKQLPIQKPVAEPRVTRLQRRKSLSVALTVQKGTSPVKMTPVPRQATPKTQPPKEQIKPPPPPRLSMREDIFPRPAASQAMLIVPRNSSTIVRAAMPQPAKTVLTSKSATQLGVGSMSKSLPTTPVSAASTTGQQAAATGNQSDVIDITMTEAPTDPRLRRHDSLDKKTNKIVVSNMPKPTMRDNSTQVRAEIFSDDHFLDIIRPQMREMNPRQKMQFKQKVFQALMETFDDATDFPAAGQVQHFNINTPSGYEHVSEPELRLMRALVSMVSAAKHTAEIAQPAAAGIGHHPQRQIIQRVYSKTTTPTTPNSPSAKGNAETPDKRVYRILQMTGSGTKVNGTPITATTLRAANEGTGGALTTTPGPRPGTFVLPTVGGGKVTVARPQDDPVKTLNSNNHTHNHTTNANTSSNTNTHTLTSLFGASTSESQASPVANGTPTTKTVINPNSVQLRQMARRYSICGSGGPNNVHTPADFNLARTSLGKPGADGDGTSVLKRRLAAPAQPIGVQQRARYSQGVNVAVAQTANSLLNRNQNPNTMTTKQISPQARQRTPQITSVSGATGSGYAFISPSTSVRPGGPNMVSFKRNLVLANTKASGVSTTTTSTTTVATTTVQPVRAPSKQLAELASLLSESKNATMVKTPSSAKNSQSKQTETAATIAADDYTLSSLKREPQDADEDHDILGM